MLSVIYKVFWLGSFNWDRVLILSHHLTIDKLTGRKFWKIKREKIDELQKGAWDDERFDREQSY